MIQALNNILIEADAPKGVKADKQAMALKNNQQNPEQLLESMDFANELMASLSDGKAAVLIDGVEVSPESKADMPLALPLAPMSGMPESTGSKSFDPSMTEIVELITQPKTTHVDIASDANGEVLKLAETDGIPVEKASIVNPEFSQALLKSPQLTLAGRAPAIELTQSEVDPQLMNMEDFVAQKNLSMKKTTGQGYGVQKPSIQKLAKENDLKSTQVVKEVASLEGTLTNTSSTPVNSQQFILNMMNEQNSAPMVNDAQGTQKVFNMSQLKTDNANQVMDQITDYIVQAKAAKEPRVNMRVNHDELGMLDITVQKSINGSGQNAVAVSIGVHSAEGKNFFQQNSKELFSHLSQAGINVSDFKVETPTQTAKNDFDMNQHSSRQGSSQDKQFGSEQNQRRHESERRQDLWNLLKDREAA